MNLGVTFTFVLYFMLYSYICQKSHNSTPPIYQILMTQTSDDRCLFVRMYQLPGSSSAITKIWRWNSCWTLQRNSKTHRRKNNKGVERCGEKSTRRNTLCFRSRNISGRISMQWSNTTNLKEWNYHTMWRKLQNS